MLDAFTLDQLRTFVVVAECGSFRAGGARLSRVQSAVSRTIANLEAELKVKVFDRTGRKPELTPEGRAVLADAKAILVKVDAMRARARGLGEGVELVLSIAIDPLVPVAQFAAALEDHRVRYPSVGITLTTAPMGAALHAVLTKNCSLAVTTAELHNVHVEAECLGPLLPLVAVCSTRHPLARTPGRIWAAADLADHIQIVVKDPSPMTDGQDFGVLSPGTWRVSDLSTKLALILEGSGWGNLPFWMVEADLRAGRLARVATIEMGKGAETDLEARLLRRIDEPLGPAARHLRERLIARFDVLSTDLKPDRQSNQIE